MKFTGIKDPAYEVVMKEKLPDIHAEGILLKHKKSGARVMLLPCADPNKVFSIGFRTPPKNATGVAHIIEHCVLCGSEHFPVKDPFVELAKGSLNTFLNAMTFPDKTIYPVASMNDKDFKNLLHVYLDAVFYPNIYREEKIFRQEGWHYHLEKPGDELTLNGVVYNEMKGVFSDPDEVMERESFHAMFPDTAYGVESGGDPEYIPDLSYEEFLDFHRTYYHPSNSYLYLYGNVRYEEILRFIDRNYLSRFDRIDVDSKIRKQKGFRKAKTVKINYPVKEGESLKDRTYLLYNVSVADPFDLKEILAVDILDHALFSSPGAPVKQALTDAGIGQEVSGIFNDGILQPMYTVAARGAKASDAERFLSVLKKALRKEVRNGIDKNALKAAIQYHEFQFREGDYATIPKGLMYHISTMSSWLYDDGCPFLYLKRLRVYRELKKELKTEGPGYFEKLLEKSFLKNPYSVYLIGSPKRGLTKKKDAALAKKLARYKASLSEKEIRSIVRATRDLRAYQEAEDTPEQLASIPTLKRKELSKAPTAFVNKVHRIAGVPVVTHPLETNGIDYITLFFDTKAVPAEDLPCLGLLKLMLGMMDTKRRSFAEVSKAISLDTGGISFALTTSEDPGDSRPYRLYLTATGKALEKRTGKMLSLMKEILKTSKLTDERRLLAVLSENRMLMQTALNQGSSFAAMRASAYHSAEAAAREQIGGITLYDRINELCDDPAGQMKALAETLSGIAKKVFCRANLKISLTASEKETERVLALLEPFVKAFPGGEVEEEETIRPYGQKNEGFCTAGQVQFAAMAGNFRDAGYPYQGTMQVLRHILNCDYLWNNIRVKGGAYGCGTQFKRNGELALYTYRDPHLAASYRVFEAIPDYIRNFRADDDTMTKYLIGTINSADIPLTPYLYGAACMQAYLGGITNAERKRIRREILQTTDADIRSLAKAVKAALSMNDKCVIGSEQKIRDDARELLTVRDLR